MKILRILLLAAVVTGAISNVFSQSKAVPIAEMKISGLMGGSENGKWLTPSLMADKMKESTEFVLAGFKGVEEGGITLGKKAETEDVCQDFVRLDFELESQTGIALGSSAKWNPVPRIPEEIALNSPTYKTIVANYLKTKSILKPVVKLTQAYRVDLEGDGVDEVLITATYYRKGLTASASAGDYSVVFLRKVVGKTVTNHELVGEYVKKKIDFGAPYEYTTSAIADLNGDGKMEIVIYGEYYEGAFSSAFEMKNGKPVSIKELEIGCGV